VIACAPAPYFSRYGKKMNKRFAYTYRIDQCDILDKENGEAFRQTRLKWMEWLYGDDPHSIFRQIYSMVWDYALFCVVNELRRLAATEPKNGVSFNGSVIRQFDAGFVTTQVIAIRRLIEKPKPDPDWAVISLRSILKDIKENTHLVTRENYVCYDGLPYDYEAAHRHWLSTFPSHTDAVHADWLSTTGPTAWHMSEFVHKNFDKLSGVNSGRRERTDTIKPDLFAHLESQIDTCKNIKKYVDKFIAHASAPETRIGLPQNQRALTLDRLKAHHKTIYQVASFISGQLLYESNLGGLPVPQSDHLANLDKSWATVENLKRARRVWEEYAKEVSEWDSASLWPLAGVEDETNGP
jgi:hypothetical protein